MKYTESKINDIFKEFGSPCYVFDEVAFRKNYLNLLHTLQKEYPWYNIGYSYKTNYAPKICSIVKDLGGYAEVVSDMEYEIAKTVGYENNKIIYNGPFKGAKMEEHLLAGGILNIDNLEEVHRVIEFSKKHLDQQFNVGIRVNICIGQKFISRFGIDADSEDMENAVVQIEKAPNVKLVGLHCHIGQSRGLEAWKNRTNIMLKLADKYINGIPAYLDLGSGMFGDMPDAMVKQFTCKIPTYEEYAVVTARTVREHYKNISVDKMPILFTEPGTTVDNRYIDLLAKVDSIKQIKGQSIAILNCSIHNLGDVSGSVKMPITVVHRASSCLTEYENMNWAGYTCLERDVPYRGYNGKLAKDDYIVFGNVGGYSNVDKPPFILPQCAMIGIDGENTYVIKRRETVEDILSTYTI